MNEENETGYFTQVDQVSTSTTGQWVYVERTVSVPANMRELNIRVDNNGIGTVWFDDIRIKKGASEIIEENNYYPFGLRHQGYNQAVSANGNAVAQKRKFGGFELQDELNLQWYDMTARNYDPALGRWMNLDPLAEQMRRHSPYNYAFNNPIYWIDPDGMAPTGNYGQSFENSAVSWTSSNSADWEYTMNGEHMNHQEFTAKYGKQGDGSGGRNDKDLKKPDNKEGKCPPDCSDDYGSHSALFDDVDGWAYRGDESSPSILDISPEELAQRNEWFITIVTLPADLTGISALGKWFLKKFIQKQSLKLTSKIVYISARKLQKKFKHAIHFGISGNYNKTNAAKFANAINKHINSKGTQVIKGTYRGDAVLHHLDPKTGLNVITDLNNQFVSGWKLGKEQLKNVLKHGGLN